MGEENPFRAAQAAKGGRACPQPAMPAVGMDPLEAGERVLHGVLNNDLFILTHPEFKAGIQERCDAIMASTPSVETPIPAGPHRLREGGDALWDLRARSLTARRSGRLAAARSLQEGV